MGCGDTIGCCTDPMRCGDTVGWGNDPLRCAESIPRCGDCMGCVDLTACGDLHRLRRPPAMRNAGAKKEPALNPERRPKTPAWTLKGSAIQNMLGRPHEAENGAQPTTLFLIFRCARPLPLYGATANVHPFPIVSLSTMDREELRKCVRPVAPGPASQSRVEQDRTDN